MNLPTGKERENIQALIDAWVAAKPGLTRGLLEHGLYQAVHRYLPDTSTNMGVLATMVPTMIDILVAGKGLDREDVVIWDGDDGEPRVGRCPEPPADAIHIPFGLLKALMQMHGTYWAARSAGDQALKDEEGKK